MQEAVKLFQQAIESSHGAPDIFLRIGISVYDCGYFDLSYKMFHTLFSVVDDDWKDGWSYLALCCKELGKNEEYVEAVRKACEQNPDEARLVLGDFFPPTLSPEQYVDYILHQK
jgi:tetratricopeptide (TPR) repeat protein